MKKNSKELIKCLMLIVNFDRLSFLRIHNALISEKTFLISFVYFIYLYNFEILVSLAASMSR